MTQEQIKAGIKAALEEIHRLLALAEQEEGEEGEEGEEEAGCTCPHCGIFISAEW